MPVQLSDLRQAARGLRRRPGFALAAAGTLALGVGATALVFGAVERVLLRPLPFPAPERLVQVWETTPDRDRRPAAPANFLDWRTATRELEGLAAYDVRFGSLGGEDRPERVRYATVSAGFFRTLGLSAAHGRTFLADDPSSGDGRPAVLSHGLWAERFGGAPEVLGRQIHLEGQDYLVVGVLPPGAGFPEGTRLWVRAPHDVPDIAMLPPGIDLRQMRDAWYFRVVGRVAESGSLERAQAELDAIARRLAAEHPETNEGSGVRLVPLQAELTGEVRPLLLLLFAAVGFVLLMATANVGNLLLARGAGRRRELAVRAALGAGGGALVRPLFAEAALLAALGGTGGLVLAAAGARALPALLPAGVLPPDFSFGGAMAACALGVSVVAALGTGALPALVARRSPAAPLLGGRGQAGAGGRRLRAGLVVTETALAVVLVAGAVLALQSLWRLQAVEPGFRPEGLLTLQLALPGARSMDAERSASLYAQVVERVSALPGVEFAAIATGGPLDDGPGAGLRVEGRSHDDPPDVSWQRVTPAYFRAAGIPLRAGRFPEASDDGGARPVGVVNETFARRFFPDEPVLGRRIRTGLDGDDVWVTVVGVAGDTRNEGPAADVSPEMYRPMAQPARSRPEQVLLLVRSAAPAERLVPPLRAAVAEVLPGAPLFAIRSGTEMLREHIEPGRSLLGLLGTFAWLALLLGAVGTYGVLAHGVVERRREIAVRMAVGARPARVVAQVVGSGLRLAGAGIALGLVGALAAGAAMRGVLYGVTTTSPLALACVAGLLLGTAVLASALPARRAAAVQPMESLRGESG